MKISSKPNVLLTAVVAGMPIFGMLCSASAQYANGNGHLLDANHQVGSGGYNGNPGGRLSSQQINNNIVNGDVSGLRYFHGPTREFDPNQVNVNTGSANSDRLNAIAGPTIGAGGTHYEASISQSPTPIPYYNSNSFVGTPPTGLAPTDNGAGLVPIPQINPLIPSSDTRIDPSGLLFSNPAANNLAPQGQPDAAAGPVNPSASGSLYTMSPLYGVRSLQADNQEDTFYQSRYGNIRTTAQNPDAGKNSSQIQQMQNELKQSALPDQTPGDQSNPSAPGSAPGSVPGSMPLDQGPLKSNVGSSDALPAGNALDSSLKTSSLNGDLNTGQGQQNTLLIPPAKQSKQLQELERRFSTMKGKPDDVEAARRLNEELKAQKEGTGTLAKPGDVAPGQVAPGQVAPGAAPGITPDSHLGKPADDAAARPDQKPILNGDSAVNEKPLIITSLATGTPAKGLSDLLKTAEDKMRQGKYTEAVDTYETAQHVAPNNPFVYLGRSFAELGSSYYGKADLDLRRAVIVDPAVLAGRYDLNGFLGQDRVGFVSDELTKMSTTEKGARPWVLLAFVAHNTGDDTAAAKDLDEASTRGGYTSLVDAMRTAWGIKAPPK
jgi:hypothetical protein